MKKSTMRALYGASVLGVVLAVAGTAVAQEEILKKITDSTVPTYDRNKDMTNPDYRAEFIRIRNEVMASRSELIGVLFEKYPLLDETAEFIGERWQTLAGDAETRGFVRNETAKVIENWPDHRALKDAYFWRANSALYDLRDAEDVSILVDETLAMIGDLRTHFPEDGRSASLTYQLGAYYITDADQALALFRSLKTDYPESQEAQRADGKIYQYEALGKPFELAFTEAVSGTEISMAQLRGKVVVLDFWATWCGPCIAEMPNMKKLYAEYQSQGVEFVGISLDAPRNEEDESKDGLALLRNYVKENGVEWPQYYQGNAWQSEFSSGWKINSIPALFVVDAEGNLASVNARGQLETLLPKLIKKRDTRTGG